MKLENLYKHPFSTIVGLCLVIYALAGLWVGKFDYTVAGPILFAGLYGLGKKDAHGIAPIFSIANYGNTKARIIKMYHRFSIH